MTDAEQHLWRYLRMRQLAGFKFRRQHPACGYILDFACVDIRLAVELDGGQHVANIEGDEIRTKTLNQAGRIVLRFWNNDVLINIEVVLSEIYKQIDGIQPPPNLPPRMGKELLNSTLKPNLPPSLIEQNRSTIR